MQEKKLKTIIQDVILEDESTTNMYVRTVYVYVRNYVLYMCVCMYVCMYVSF